jgi:hypothetical protein
VLKSIAARARAWLRGPRALPAPPPPRPFPEGAFVAFVLPVGSPVQVNQSDHYATIIASMRLRAIIPARQLAQRVPVWFVPLENFVRDPALSALGTAGAIVISKLPAPNILQRQAALSALLARASADRTGVPLYADMPDDLAALGRAIHEPYLAQYQKGLGASCTLIVPCRSLGEGLSRDAKRGLVIIEDPYENQVQPVRARPGSPLRLMWFGNLGDLNGRMLEDALAATVAPLRDMPLQLELVTRTDARDALDAISRRLRAVQPNCALQVTEWSLQATDDALGRCDFVLIPQDVRAEWSKGKSHNRLVTAIRGGRLAIASPIPTYQELAAYAWVGENLAEGLRWALTHPDEAAARVLAGQQHVEARFSPERIGRRWASVLGID